MDEFIDPDRGDWRQQEESEAEQFNLTKERTMGFKVSSKGGGDFENAPIGMHLARCIRVIDLGTQKGEYQGKPKLARKMIVTWELLGEQKMTDGRPFIVQKWYTASLGEKAILRADLESWRGRAFTPKELEGFDLKNIINVPCMLNLVESDDGKYVNVKTVNPLPGGFVAPEAENKRVLFSLDEFDQQVFDSLSDKLKDMIRLSPEYAEVAGLRNTQVDDKGVGGIDDDIPF